MTQHFPLDYGDAVHQGFFDPIQELLGASAPSLRIKVSGSSTLTAVAGSGNSQAAVAIEGRYRFITSDVTASLPGGLTNGTGHVFVTASANNFGGGPTGPPDVGTNYAFGLEIRTTAQGNPTTALFRKVGEVDVSSGSIVAFRPMAGPRPTGEFGLVGTPDAASQPGLMVQGVSGQSASVVQVKNSSGTLNYEITAAGASTQAGGLTVTSTDGITVSGNAGKTALNLSNASSGGNTGITIGGDVEIYRSAANTLQTDDGVVIRRGTSADSVLSTKVTTDSNDRVNITAGGDVRFGSGAASPDVRLRRSATNQVTIDDTSTGAASLNVTGALTVGTTLTLSQATTAGHVPISNGSGLMSLGQISTSSINDSAVTTAKIADGTIVNGDISASAAIAESKLSLASDAAAGTASRRTLGTGATQACAGNDSRLSDSRTPTGAAGGSLSGTYPNPTIKASDTEGVPMPIGYSATSTTITARKYADGQVVVSGVIVYPTWPGYFSSFTAFGQTWSVLELGTLPSGYTPTADLVTTGIGYVTSNNQVVTSILILTTGEIAGRVSGGAATQPLRWGLNATFHAA